MGPTWPRGKEEGLGGCVSGCGSSDGGMGGRGMVITTPALVPTIRCVGVGRRCVRWRDELLCCRMIGL